MAFLILVFSKMHRFVEIQKHETNRRTNEQQGCHTAKIF